MKKFIDIRSQDLGGSAFRLPQLVSCLSIFSFLLQLCGSVSVILLNYMLHRYGWLSLSRQFMLRAPWDETQKLSKVPFVPRVVYSREIRKSVLLFCSNHVHNRNHMVK